MDIKPGVDKYSRSVNGIDIYFKCQFIPGSNEAVLCLHGLGCSSGSFSNIFEGGYLPDKTIIVPDFAGFGNSAKPAKFSYSMEEQAAIIEELMGLFPKLKIHIAAHSMGGAVGLLFSRGFFDRVASFANIEGNLIAEDCGILSRGIAGLTFEKYKEELFPKQLNEFAGHNQLRFEESTPEAIYRSAVSLVKCSDSGELLERFERLKCKKCYIFGEENRGMPVLRRLRAIPIVMISRAGHNIMTDNPDEFYPNLAAFINIQKLHL